MYLYMYLHLYIKSLVKVGLKRTIHASHIWFSNNQRIKNVIKHNQCQHWARNDNFQYLGNGKAGTSLVCGEPGNRAHQGFNVES